MPVLVRVQVQVRVPALPWELAQVLPASIPVWQGLVLVQVRMSLASILAWVLVLVRGRVQAWLLGRAPPWVLVRAPLWALVRALLWVLVLVRALPWELARVLRGLY